MAKNKTKNKIRVSITIDPGIYVDAKRIAGLIPFSRYVENLIGLNIQQDQAFEKIPEEKK